MWKERPPCVICGSPSYIFMFDNCFCNECTIKQAEKDNKMVIGGMKEDFENGKM